MTNWTGFVSTSTPPATPPLTAGRRRIVVRITARPPTAGSSRPPGKYRKRSARGVGRQVLGRVEILSSRVEERLNFGTTCAKRLREFCADSLLIKCDP